MEEISNGHISITLIARGIIFWYVGDGSILEKNDFGLRFIAFPSLFPPTWKRRSPWLVVGRNLGCFKINNFEKLKFLQILEFCQLFSTSSFSFYAVSVTKSYPMHKIKCVGNEILLHLKYFKVLKRGFLTKLGGLTWPLNEKVKISLFDEQLGHLDGWFLAKKTSLWHKTEPNFTFL